MMKKRNFTGQSLIEAVVAVGIVIILVTGLIVGTTASVHRAVSSSSRSLAVKYAQEGMELARKVRDNGWMTLIEYNNTYCVGKDSLVPVPTPTPVVGAACSANIDSIYTRSITFAYAPDTQIMTIDVNVSWYEAGQTRSIALQTYLSQWK